MVIYPPTDWTRYPLHVAAMSGHLKEVERLLAEGKDVNENIFLEGTPLHLAIRRCATDRPGLAQFAVARLLLSKGASVHLRRNASGTPLHEVAGEGDTRVAEFLLDHGAEINSKEDDHHRTPLHWAVAAGKGPMVEYLLSKGADVDAVADFRPHPCSARYFSESGMTPLQVAAREGHLEIARQLLLAGARKDIEVQESALQGGRFRGYTALDFAVDYTVKLKERLPVCRELLELLE